MCTDFATRIGEAETRISKLEDETATQVEIRESLRSQMEDTQWKMADLENRARQNTFESWVSHGDEIGRFMELYGESTQGSLPRSTAMGLGEGRSERP
ncbi:hypothetical protein NDU88_005735 [Pleurodeles waltl]|uniref:Uncharacterized protein n=1 Tax=Pleurodeles waltl TaxID=8319 RepID=A0AAV7NPW7_PLEWA|nr:hypothetical protein NDU88_005735 [Pleurodeles waltl]